VNAQQLRANEPPTSNAAAAVYMVTTASAADEANLATSLVRKLLAKIRHLRQQPVAKRLFDCKQLRPADALLNVGGVEKEDISLEDVSIWW